MPRPSKKQDVLEAAATLFADYGFDAISVRDIAEKAGIRSASVYRHFPSKQDLFDAVLHWVCDNLSGSREGLLHSDMSSEQKLKGFVYATFNDHESRPIHRKILQRALIDEHQDVLETLVHRIYADQHYKIVDMIRAVDPSADPYFALYSILALSLGYIHMRPLQQIIRHLTSTERDPMFLTNVTLNMVIPHIKWGDVSLPGADG